MNKTYYSKKRILVITSVIILMIIAIVVRICYPRSSHSFKEVKSITIYFYDGEYKTIELASEKCKQVYELINKSWITHLDLLYVGDDCGGDGPSITVKYTDGTIDCWDYRGESIYCRYVYYEGVAVTQKNIIIINNPKLSDLIEEIISNNK